MTLEQHSGTFRCEAVARDGRTQNYYIDLSVLMQTSYVPPPVINTTLASHVRIGEDFTLVCSVTVDFGTVVELKWTTPNSKAIAEGRIEGPGQTARNLSMGATHLKVEEQALTIRRSTLDDQGSYTCEVEDHSRNKQKRTEFVHIREKEEPFLRTYTEGYYKVVTTADSDDDETPSTGLSFSSSSSGRSSAGMMAGDEDVGTLRRGEGPVQWVLQIESHPEPKVQW